MVVFKPLNLARQGFVKTFTHGYVQSLVAASQSSSAAQNAPSFGSFSNNVVQFFAKNSQHGNSFVQNVTQQASAPSGIGLKSSSSGQSDPSGHDAGLAAYYAAWQKHQQKSDDKDKEKEWHQFQFAKRIGWKAPTTILEPQAKAKVETKPVENEAPARAPLSRSYSTNALDDIKNQAEARAEAAEEYTASSANNDTVHQQEQASAAYYNEAESGIDLRSPTASNSETLTDSSSVTAVDPFTEQLAQLAEDQRYAEIPAVFEALLAAGNQPTPSAYNALLLAAINIPKGRHHVVNKVLDVYGDMVRRRVAPDTTTYAILIELLAARALDVEAMKKELLERQARFSAPAVRDSFLFRSDDAELKILSEDDSLSLAIKLFDTTAAVSTKHVLPAETYRILISACAATSRVGDMVRIYADMESQGITPPGDVFAPMIRAFATVGDLRSSVECYDEYKSLAIAHDKGQKRIVRKDEHVYAAVVKAYDICGRANGGLKFLGRIEDELKDTANLPLIREAIAMESLNDYWLGQGRYADAIEFATTSLGPDARTASLETICCAAADKSLTDLASQAFGLLRAQEIKSSNAVVAMLAMHVRTGDQAGARDMWELLTTRTPTVKLIEPTVQYAISLFSNGEPDRALSQARQMFSSLRGTSSEARTEVQERIDEAVETLAQHFLRYYPVSSPNNSMELISMMTDNGGLVQPIVEQLLASLGPEFIVQLPPTELVNLTRVQAIVLSGHAAMDVAHSARFSHLLKLVMSAQALVEPSTAKLIDQALTKADQNELSMQWRSYRYPSSAPTPYSPTVQQQAPAVAPFEDNFDPYGALTDFKGSSFIVEELEKTHGKHHIHLNEALSKFRNIRRAGRHPRYATYAKLITAAAKENKLNLAHDILAMAKQDIPLIPNNRVVRHGWVSILDSMVAACVTVGKRDLAAQFHQDLINIGAAPSANTYGLYITTLKESTKTFDEATEAVKIFHRAKAEGVEPSSFLYNALIGKLGKARRIDDCLFYFAEMRGLGIRPTSVTYGTIVNALCRVSDEKFAEELFEEMESMPNYKPRPAPYNCLMQYFLTTKRDRSKVLAYYERMKSKSIEPTMHTYKLLVDTHATLEPVNMKEAETVLDEIRANGARPEAVHFASIIHAKGCVQHDLEGARKTFDEVIDGGLVAPQASLYQALFESMVASHQVEQTESLIKHMKSHNIKMTPYIANTLIHGWATAKDIGKARAVFESLGQEAREPSTYEAMTRAYLSAEDHGNAMLVVGEALRRGYPSAVASKICELVGGGSSRAASLSA